MLNPLKKIYLSIFLIAVIISAIVLFFYSENLTPYKLQLAQEPIPIVTYDRVLFRDLDKDGLSERFVIQNKFTGRDIRHINIYDQNNQLKNQWNFTDSLLLEYLSFNDINNDGTEEVIVWIQDKDSLFLSILDIAKNIRLINHVFILSSPGPFPLKKWDISNIQVLFPDTSWRYMYFALTSGYCLRPRGVYLFDLQKKRLIKQSNVLATATGLQKIDTDENGVFEILFTTYATDNYEADIDYTDKKSWLILFNQNLDTLHTLKCPKPYSSFTSFPYYYNGTLFIASITTLAQKAIFSILDKKLRTIYSTKLKFNFRDLNINTSEQIFTLYGATTSSFNITKLDFQLKKLNQISFPNIIGNSFRKTLDFDRDGCPNFFSNSRQNFILLDEHLQKFAKINFEREQDVLDISFNQQSQNVLPQISINTNINNYLYNLVPNPGYTRIYYYFIIAVILLFLFLAAVHILINRIRIYFSYFLFSLKDSDNAIVLLNHKGAILSFNQKVKKILQLEAELHNTQSFKEAFARRAEVCTAIEEALIHRAQLKKEISFEDAHSTFIGELSVTPFFSFFKFTNAYLVEIKDSTRQVLADRHSNWQRTVRKMVHDIKNPLGGVQLKLQSIYMRLSDVYPEAAKELQEELETANAEIKRIRNISKDFLKFSDLDAPQFKTLNTRDFFNRILNHFAAFKNDYLRIELNLGKKLPDTIILDERQTELLLHILIENAIDAVKGTGVIEINLNLIHKTLSASQKELEIEVKDNGSGIPPEYQDKLFEPHFSTKKEGTGMGLVFAKHIVQQHNGSIDFKSSVGTSFIVKIPIIIN